MKRYASHISYLLLLVSLFLVSGNAFAVSEKEPLSKKESNIIQKTSDKHFFEEVSVVEIPFQHAEEFAHPFLLFFTGVDTYKFYKHTPLLSHTFLPKRDVKKQLDQYIFPFHFFW